MAMAKRFGDLLRYAREHRISPRRRQDEDERRDIAELVRATLNAPVGAAASSGPLNDLVRRWPPGRAKYDADYHSVGVLSACDDTVVEVEHPVEVAELVRHLNGSAYELSRRQPASAEEALASLLAAQPELEGVPVPDWWMEADGNLARQLQPDPEFESSTERIIGFLDQHCVRVLVTEDEHRAIGRAMPGASLSTLGVYPGPVGADFSRYRLAGIEVVQLGETPIEHRSEPC